MKKQYLNGFTLIEILVVIVILSILAAAIVPRFMSYPEKARVLKAKQDIMAIDNALELYKLENGRYPNNTEGLEALVHKPLTPPQTGSWHAYLKSIPHDPWGNTYQYHNPGKHNEVDVFTVHRDPKNHAHATLYGNWSVDEITP